MLTLNQNLIFYALSFIIRKMQFIHKFQQHFISIITKSQPLIVTSTKICVTNEVALKLMQMNVVIRFKKLKRHTFVPVINGIAGLVFINLGLVSPLA